jgi:hypothetical protein
MSSNSEINAAEAAAATKQKASFKAKLAESLAKAKATSGKHVAPSSSNSNSELNQNIHELAAASSTGTAAAAPLFSLATGQPTQPASNAAASSTATAAPQHASQPASQSASMSQPAHTSAALPLSANLSGTVASMTNGISHTIANPGAAGASTSGAAGANGSGAVPIAGAAGATAASVPIASAAVPARERITSKENFNSAEKAAMAAKEQENKATVEIDVPTRGSSFKTYQIPHEPVKTLPLQGLTPTDKKLILPEIDQIYEKYMIDKMKDTKDGKQYVRITYLGKDYLVLMQPMDNISDIKKAIEKTGPGHNALNKIASKTFNPTPKPMSLIELALEKQQLSNGSNPTRVKVIDDQMKQSIGMMSEDEFGRKYIEKTKLARSGKNEDIDEIKLYEKERLLRAEETRTKGLTAATLSLKDLPIELERIEKEYIRAGKPLDSLHTDRDDLDAEKYRALRDRFQAELAKNDERWGWWKDWKDPKYNRFRPKKGGYTAKKSKKNRKTKKSTRRSS